MSTECDWCQGSGCDECMNIDTQMADDDDDDVTTPIIPSECPWCDGSGCTECLEPILEGHDAPQDSTNQLPRLAIQRTASQALRPLFLDSNTPLSLSQNDITNFMSWAITNLANQLWVSFDDAEILLRSYQWNSSALSQDWLNLGADEVRKRIGIKAPVDNDPPPSLIDYLKITPVFGTQKSTSEDANNNKNDDDDNNNNNKADLFAAAMDNDDLDEGEYYCATCMSHYDSLDDIHSLPCGHITCKSCMIESIKAACELGSGPALHLTCPELNVNENNDQNYNENDYDDDDDDDDNKDGAKSGPKMTKCQQLLPYGVVLNILVNHIDTSAASLRTNTTPFAISAPTSPDDTTSLFHRDGSVTFNSVHTTYASKYRRWVTDAFVQAQPKLFLWCSSPYYCPLYIYTPLTTQPSARPTQVPDLSFTLTNPHNHTFVCPCGSLLCLNCQHPGSHYPASCEAVREFSAVFDPDASSKRLIQASSKSCPQCSVMITKDRNCNHVSCVKCGFHFCYLCKAEWKSHSNAYECSPQQQKMTADAVEEYEATLLRTAEHQRMRVFEDRSQSFSKLAREVIELVYNNVWLFKPKIDPNGDLVHSPHSSPSVSFDPTGKQPMIPLRVQHQYQIDFMPILQSLWICLNVIRWSYATTVFLPSDSSTRLLRSQQAVCAATIAGTTKSIISMLSKPTLVSIADTHQAARDLLYQVTLGIERFNKSFDAYGYDNISRWVSMELSERLRLILQLGQKDDPMVDNQAQQSGPGGISSSVTDTSADSGAVGATLKGTTKNLPPPPTMEWACTACGCLHIPLTTDLLFETLTDANGAQLFVDITEKRKAAAVSAPRITTKPAQHHGPFYNTSRCLVCANCTACHQHGDIDCRICYKK